MRAHQKRVASLRAAVSGGRASAIAAGAAVAVALGLGVAAVTVRAPSGPGERADPGGSDADAAMLVPPGLGPDEASPAQAVDLGGPTAVAGPDDPPTSEAPADGAVHVEPAAPAGLVAGPDPGTSVTTTSTTRPSSTATTTSTTRPSSTATTTPPDGSGGLLAAVAHLLGGP